MNSLGYCSYISDQYGGLLKDELYKKLLKLRESAIKETKAIIEKQPIKEMHEPKKEKPKTKEEILTIEQKINKILTANMNDYSKSLKLVDLFKNKGWYHISIIPDQLFAQFWNLSESIKSVVFDEERDFQYFKVIPTIKKFI